ncbi:MAG: restriction endonuclease subunit S [Verrucomicrobiae bacterium]|nr:restriction endonuclease subunit S [Verrucomicrobiae bacterium]
MFTEKTPLLSSVCEIVMGQAPDGSSYNTHSNGYPLIAGAGDFGALFPNPGKFTDAPTKLSHDGDIILCIRATIGDRNWSDTSYCLGRGVAGLRAKNGKLFQGYLWHWLGHTAPELKAKGRGATFLQVSKSDIGSLQIPLPPIEEQKRIAAILDAADALRVKRRESIAQLDALLQSTFLDMFGDPVTNPMGWECMPFNKIGRFLSGSTPSKERTDYWGGLIPWVSPKDMKVTRINDAIDHVTDLAFEETNLKVVEPRCVLIVVRGMILAHSFPVAVNQVPVAINQDMKAIVPLTKVNVLFLLECISLLKRQILSEVSTAGHGTKRLDSEAMKKILVPLPPLSLQRRFASIVEAAESQKARLRAHLDELDALFASLQSRAFNGEL